MSWKCPECSVECDNDTSISCQACGYVRTSVLSLISCSGNEWRTRTSTDVNRRIFKRLYPGKEHQYVSHEEGRFPFRIERNPDGWCLISNPNSPVAIALNELLCEDGEIYSLSSDDTIYLTSRIDTNRKVAPLKVKLNILG